MKNLFEVMGKKSVLCGSASSGQAAKACNNMLLAKPLTGKSIISSVGSIKK